MKRTFLMKAHLVELKREIPEMKISQEEGLSGGFLGVSMAPEEGPVANNNYYQGCHCTVNTVAGCGAPSTATVTPTATATRTMTIVIPVPSL